MAEPTKRERELAGEIVRYVHENNGTSLFVAHAIAAERERILAVFRELAEEMQGLALLLRKTGEEHAFVALDEAHDALRAAIRKVEGE